MSGLTSPAHVAKAIRAPHVTHRHLSSQERKMSHHHKHVSSQGKGIAVRRTASKKNQKTIPNPSDMKGMSEVSECYTRLHKHMVVHHHNYITWDAVTEVFGLVKQYLVENKTYDDLMKGKERWFGMACIWHLVRPLGNHHHIHLQIQPSPSCSKTIRDIRLTDIHPSVPQSLRNAVTTVDQVMHILVTRYDDVSSIPLSSTSYSSSSSSSSSSASSSLTDDSSHSPLLLKHEEVRVKCEA